MKLLREIIRWTIGIYIMVIVTYWICRGLWYATEPIINDVLSVF